jgi:hypothetical protein
MSRKRAALKPYLAIVGYQAGAVATLIYLTWRDGISLAWWKYPLMLALNLFLAEIWPIFWLILRPIFG